MRRGTTHPCTCDTAPPSELPFILLWTMAYVHSKEDLGVSIPFDNVFTQYILVIFCPHLSVLPGLPHLPTLSTSCPLSPPIRKKLRHTLTHTHIHSHILTHTYTPIHSHTFSHTHIHSYSYIYSHTHSHIHIHSHILTQTHTHSYT